MQHDTMKESGFTFIAKGQKPLCATNYGLLTYKKHKLFLYKGGKFSLLKVYPSSISDKIKELNRISQRLFRTEPQNAVANEKYVYVANRNSIDQIDIEAREIVARHKFRKPYVHTDRSGLVMITDVPGFDNCVAYGEYFSNEKKEDVHIFIKPFTGHWKDVYSFAPNTIRHIHSLIPDKVNGCVYVLTGDADSESGIWKATNNFSNVEPLLVGDQIYRSGVAFAENSIITYATDMPSRPNSIYSYNVRTGEFKTIMRFPASCTVGCYAGGRKVFCSTFEAVEPKNHGILEMLKYYFRRKPAAGVLDEFVRVYMENQNGSYKELLKCKKDFLPPALFQLGKIPPVYDEQTSMLYVYPISVKKYDGKLYSKIVE